MTAQQNGVGNDVNISGRLLSVSPFFRQTISDLQMDRRSFNDHGKGTEVAE